ncbi:MAG TPA: putative zinc-binding protein [Candidatus Hydrogenedentes bacterium]|nr:putative zinc-binding protein [Candidatus Hydrogenedentota bacterium]
MSTSTEKGCACSGAPALIFACSGAADVGELADRTARQLTRDGSGKMYCLAGVGGQVNNILVNVKAAAKILAIDGCPTNCARCTLEQAGIGEYKHVCLQDAGFAKGKSPVNDENLKKAVEAARARL